MKKIISAVAIVLAMTIPALAAQDDMRLTFKTKGPDAYKDGTRVLDNEFYALVWVADGAPFGGFNADGTLAAKTGNEIVALVPFAEGGRLPLTVKQIASADAARYNGGSFRILALDTRQASGALSAPRVDANGRPIPSRVNGYSEIYAMAPIAAAYAAALEIDSPIQISAVSAIPEGTPKPVITDAKVRRGAKGQEFVIRVKGTVPFLDYTAASLEGGEVGTVEAGDSEKEIEIVIPATNDKGLFKIIRR